MSDTKRLEVTAEMRERYRAWARERFGHGGGMAYVDPADDCLITLDVACAFAAAEAARAVEAKLREAVGEPAPGFAEAERWLADVGVRRIDCGRARSNCAKAIAAELDRRAEEIAALRECNAQLTADLVTQTAPIVPLRAEVAKLRALVPNVGDEIDCHIEGQWWPCKVVVAPQCQGICRVVRVEDPEQRQYQCNLTFKGDWRRSAAKWGDAVCELEAAFHQSCRTIAKLRAQVTPPVRGSCYDCAGSGIGESGEGRCASCDGTGDAGVQVRGLKNEEHKLRALCGRAAKWMAVPSVTMESAGEFEECLSNLEAAAKGTR